MVLAFVVVDVSLLGAFVVVFCFFFDVVFFAGAFVVLGSTVVYIEYRFFFSFVLVPFYSELI